LLPIPDFAGILSPINKYKEVANSNVSVKEKNEKFEAQKHADSGEHNIIVNKKITNKDRFKSDVFSISGAIKEVNGHKNTQQSNVNSSSMPKITGKTPFDLNKVKSVIENYVENCKDAALIANLTAHNPKLNGNVVTLFVDNELQIKEMNSKLSSIRYSFASLLDNGDLRLKVSLSDDSMKDDKKRFYTKEEIYELFKKENPVVEDLKKLFMLDIDYK